MPGKDTLFKKHIPCFGESTPREYTHETDEVSELFEVHPQKQTICTKCGEKFILVDVQPCNQKSCPQCGSPMKQYTEGAVRLGNFLF